MSSSFELAVRQLDYWATVYRRTWKGTVVSSFVNPLLYVLAMGVLLGGFIAGDPAKLEGAPTYLAFIAPGLLAAQSMQTAVGETTYPVMSMVKWQKVYFGMQATPLRPVDLVNAHLGFIVFRLAHDVGGVRGGARAVRRLPLAARRGGRVAGGGARGAGDRAAGLRVRGRLHPTSRRSRWCSGSV